MTETSAGTGTHRHFEIERHSDRLEGRASQRVFAAYLRDECPCATCTGAHGTEPQKSELFRRRRRVRFQMFKPTLKMLNVEAVGHYAIRIEWSDGHNTGIYSFDHLRKICACEECRAAEG